MTPQMMQQMQAMQNGGGVPFNPQAMSASPMNGGAGQRPGYTPQEQMAFEQRKYEQQAGGANGGAPLAAGGPRMGSGGPSSWDGMYEDVPAPGGGRGGFGGRGRGAHRGSQGPPQGQAPANAPTGPKNAGRPGANYRGGGRGGGHRGGFHPYARGGA